MNVTRPFLIAAGIAVSGLASTDTPCVTDAPPRILGYVEVLDRYREDEVDEALGKLRYLSLGTVSRLIHDRELPLSDDCLQAAALLHTESAMADEEASERHASQVHWRAARSLIDRMKDERRRDRLRRDWLLAAGYYFQRTIFAGNTRSGFDRAKRYFDEAVRLFPDDPDVLVSAGTLYEWNGSKPLGTKDDLSRAQELYARAVTVDPRSAEGWLRLGRTLETQGRYQEAEGPFRAVLTHHESDFLDYFAHLFLGRLSERSGRLGEAVGHYRTATRLLPHWQIAYVALAHGLRVSGHRDEARAVAFRAVSLQPPFAHLDGWWVYERGRCGRLLPLLKQLREEVAL